MPYLLSLVQVVLLSVLLFQYTATFPSGNRNGEIDESFISWDSPSCRRCLFPRESTAADESPADDRGFRGFELQTRQLGDLEFTSRHAELLKSKAKQSSLCSFLRRMQNSKKSGFTGDTEHMNTLMKQYMCANLYQ
ncbi:hypothetical protein C0J50_10986 [Silurus asotus]|uniref:Uncharacterized protein n=1 Tax=Silurus asotus TaxID=30991 RepID=A0AAD5FGR5_SILAS|nr:hypothetical protein C0J50_10986 [Silurus asotus]